MADVINLNFGEQGGKCLKKAIAKVTDKII